MYRYTLHRMSICAWRIEWDDGGKTREIVREGKTHIEMQQMYHKTTTHTHTHNTIAYRLRSDNPHMDMCWYVFVNMYVLCNHHTHRKTRFMAHQSNASSAAAAALFFVNSRMDLWMNCASRSVIQLRCVRFGLASQSFSFMTMMVNMCNTHVGHTQTHTHTQTLDIAHIFTLSHI